MAVIDTLTLQLGLDPRQFIQGRNEAEHALAQSQQSLARYGQNFESQGKKIGDAFGIIKAGAAGIVGAFVGGQAATWIDGLMRMDNAAGNLSKTIGSSIPNISLWQNLVKLVGGEANEATGAMAGLRQAINNALQGGGMLPDGAASLLNRAVGDFRGKPAEKIIDNLIDYFDEQIKSKRMRPDEAATMLRRLPGMTEGMINLILKGRDAINEMTAALVKQGVATDESARQSAEYVKQEGLLIAQLQDVGRLAFPPVTEAIKTFSESIRGISGTMREWGAVIGANGSDLTKWADTVRSIFSSDAVKNFFSGHVVEGGFLDRLMKFSKEHPTVGTVTWDSLKKLIPDYVPGTASPASPVTPARAALPPAQNNAPTGSAGGVAGGQGGYTAKPGSGQTSLLTDTLASKIQSDVSGVNRFTAFNDPYHAFLGGGAHPKGRALDFTIKDPSKSAEVAEQVRAILKEMGLQGTVLDEYKTKSGNWTAGHIHVQVSPPSPAAARALTGAADRPTGAPAAATMGPGKQSQNVNSMREGDTTQTSEVHIGTLNVNAPKATDAHGIARDMQKQLQIAMAFNSAQA